MAPKNTAHEWTDFELHTLLCLLAKGVHLEERGNRNDSSATLKRHAYLNVATALNTAVHGKDNYDKDIDKREVARMIDLMLDEKKGVVGQGGYMERATKGRITRGLKMIWNREPSFDYNGTLGEWNSGRKEKEAEKRRIAAGGKPKEVVQSIEDGGEDGPENDALWCEVEIAASTRRPNDLPPASQTVIDKPQRPSTGHDAFTRLPSSLRNRDRFAWADPSHAAENRLSRTPPPLIDSYRPNYSQPSSRYEQMANPYRPGSQRIDEGYHASTSWYHFQPSPRQVSDYQTQPTPRHYSDQQSQPTPHHNRFEFYSDTIASTPSLVPGYSSSPSKSIYTSTARPSAARSAASRTLVVADPTSYDDATLARAIENELAQRQKSSFKKPGILKHRPMQIKLPTQGRVDYFEEGGGRMEVTSAGGRTPDDGINPARRAMLAVSGNEDMEMPLECMEKDNVRRPVVKDANAEELKFNRLERLRQSSAVSAGGTEDVEMGVERQMGSGEF